MLHALAMRFVAFINGENNPGQWTHTLHVTYKETSKTYISDILTLLLNMPVLQAFGTCEPASLGELTALSRVARVTLQDLHISLDHILPLGLMIDSLRHLKALAKLVMIVHANHQSPQYETSLLIDLPVLVHLECHMTGDYHRDVLGVLSRSRFPALRKVILALPDLASSAPRLLQEFFTNHTHLSSLAMELPWKWINTFLGLSITVEHMNFTNCVPPANSVVQLLGPHVRSLSVRASIRSMSIWMLFDVMLLAEELSLCEIHVALPERFQWVSGGRSDDLALFVGKMLYYSSLLEERGIRIFDEDGWTAKRLRK